MIKLPADLNIVGDDSEGKFGEFSTYGDYDPYNCLTVICGTGKIEQVPYDIYLPVETLIPNSDKVTFHTCFGLSQEQMDLAASIEKFLTDRKIKYDKGTFMIQSQC